MSRTARGLGLALAALLVPLIAVGQLPARVFRVGFLANGSAATSGPSLEAFKSGLRDLGYVEGRTVMVDVRYADGRADQLPVLAADLRRQNVTGKRLALLKETLPGIVRVAALVDSTVSAAGVTEESEAAARSLGLRLQIVKVAGPAHLAEAFRQVTATGAEALLVLASPFLSAHRRTVVELAAKHRLPTTYEVRWFVETGGLMSYGPNFLDMYRRSATHVDKILRGARPAELPVEQATTFEMAVNLRTAKTLGLTIPPSVLLRADLVIE